MKKTLAARLERSRLVIDGALANPPLIKKTTPFGYDRKTLQQAHNQYLETYGLQMSKDDELGAQRDATLALRDAQDEAHQLYMKHVKIIRMALPKEEELWKKLGISGKRETTLTGWLSQVNRFYQNTDQVQEALAQFNVLPEELEQAREKVQAVAGGYSRTSERANRSNSASSGMPPCNNWRNGFAIL